MSKPENPVIATQLPNMSKKYHSKAVVSAEPIPTKGLPAPSSYEVAELKNSSKYQVHVRKFLRANPHGGVRRLERICGQIAKVATFPSGNKVGKPRVVAYALSLVTVTPSGKGYVLNSAIPEGDDDTDE